MALSNYGELRASVADWLNREDLDDKIADFVRLAEAEINQDPRSRTRYTETTLTLPNLTTTDPFGPIDLPTTFIEMLSVRFNDKPLTRVPDTVFFDIDEDNSDLPAQAEVYTIFDGKLYISAWPDEAGTDWTGDELVLRFHAGVDLASGADGDTNALLTNAPNVYIYGTLFQAGMYLQDFVMTDRYGAKFNQALELIKRQHRRAQVTDVMSVSSGVRQPDTGYHR